MADDSRHGPVRAFGGDNRLVADYLSGEVLAALDEDDRAFLYGVAVLGEFTAEMCDAVLDRGDSAARLVELERSNLFVSRLDRGGWFRIHSLFAEYARARLASVDPGGPGIDSSPSRGVAQIAGVGGRSSRACGRGRRSRARGGADGRAAPWR
jgi:ATP/maltotriose-dependent transcriptional regulator MalT